MKGLRRRDIAVMVIVFSAAVWLAGMMHSSRSKQAIQFCAYTQVPTISCTFPVRNAVKNNKSVQYNMKGTINEHPHKGFYR